MTTTVTSSTHVQQHHKKLRDSNVNTLNQRVFEFEKTAKYMIKKLNETKAKIDNENDNELIEHLKMSIAPDAATLISQGDSLVLETHGTSSPELANTVMTMQTILREKFREVQHAR